MSKKVAKIEQTMSSVALVALINDMREDGSAEIAHSDFMKKIVRVLGEEGAGNFSGTYLDIQGKKRPCYNLPKREASLMVMSESYKIQAAVYDKMVELEQQLITAESHRQALRLEYRPMTDALRSAREEQGKLTSFFHYSNEINMIYRVAFGATAKQLKDVLDDGNLRDVLTPLQQKCVMAMQKANTVYLEEGLGFDERKDRLTKLFNRKFENLLYEEHIKLTA